jgi:hypothetical protein
MEFQILFIVILMFIGDNANSQQSLLGSKISPFFRFGRESFNLFIKPKTFERGIELNVKNNRTQRQFSDKERFFCDVSGARSKTVPKSV